MRVALGEVLRALLGYSVELAENAEDALAIIRSGGTAFAAVLVDRNLPGMTGDDLVARLAEGWPATPVVLMSGDGDAAHDADEVHPRSAYQLRHLKKPFSVQVLGRVLEEVIADPSVQSPVATQSASASAPGGADERWRRTDARQGSNPRNLRE